MYAENRGRRIGQSAYWGRFAVFMIGVPALIGFGIYSLLVSRDFALGVLAIVAIFPLSIWFRFVMMRRCRDAGWPIFLPWTAQALQFLMFVLFFAGGGLSGGLDAARAMSSGSMLVGLADFVLVIALGCVKSRSGDIDYADVFGGEAVVRAQPAPHYHAPQYHDIDPREQPSTTQAREDAAIARALAAYRSGATPRVGGFGRKGL